MKAASVTDSVTASVWTSTKRRVFATASMMTPDEWIRHVTGEPLNPDYYLDYLEEKFCKLYNLT